MLQTPLQLAEQSTEEERKVAYLFCAAAINQAIQSAASLDPRIRIEVDRIAKTMRAAGQVSPIVNTAIELEVGKTGES